jgi:hypothetical protein
LKRSAEESIVQELELFFDEPDAAMFREVAARLPALPIVSDEDILAAVGEERRSQAKVGNTLQALADLKAVFEKDFANNLAETVEVPWSFNYCLTWKDGGVSNKSFRGLGVFTRLFNPDAGEGGISYGSTIYRTGDDRFVYWDDQ